MNENPGTERALGGALLRRHDPPGGRSRLLGHRPIRQKLSLIREPSELSKVQAQTMQKGVKSLEPSLSGLNKPGGADLRRTSEGSSPGGIVAGIQLRLYVPERGSDAACNVGG